MSGHIQIMRNYMEVLKPRESVLLAFLGCCSAVIAGFEPFSPAGFSLILFAVLLASAGANGLTNYLDRNLDAKMERTKHRSLPSKRIQPAEKVLPLISGLIILGLILSCWLHPYVFLTDLAGTTAAVVWRKRWTCVFPQGVIASCAPVLMGWLAVKPYFSIELLLLCLLTGIWLPVHLWSVMAVYRDDYLKAGLSYFPLKLNPATTRKILLAFSILLYLTSIALHFAAGFQGYYLVMANILGITLLYTSIKLVVSGSSRVSWKLYKLSAFPYLGVVFLTMALAG